MSDAALPSESLREAGFAPERRSGERSGANQWFYCTKGTNTAFEKGFGRSLVEWLNKTVCCLATIRMKTSIHVLDRLYSF